VSLGTQVGLLENCISEKALRMTALSVLVAVMAIGAAVHAVKHIHHRAASWP